MIQGYKLIHPFDPEFSASTLLLRFPANFSKQLTSLEVDSATIFLFFFAASFLSSSCNAYKLFILTFFLISAEL
jgi:hypothetical protein